VISQLDGPMLSHFGGANKDQNGWAAVSELASG